MGADTMEYSPKNYNESDHAVIAHLPLARAVYTRVALQPNGLCENMNVSQFREEFSLSPTDSVHVPINYAFALTTTLVRAFAPNQLASAAAKGHLDSMRYYGSYLETNVLGAPVSTQAKLGNEIYESMLTEGFLRH